MRRKLIIGLCILVVLLAGIGIYLRNGFYGNCVPERRSLYVRSGSEYRTLEDSLDAAIAHTAFFRFYARHIELDRSFKPGHYVLEPGMNIVQVARMLKLGLQTPVRVTINNVRTPAQLAGKLARQIEADSATIVGALTDPATARKAGFDSVTLFSMFIPDTYEFYWTVSPAQFIERMRREYDRFWTPQRDAKRQRSGLSRLEVMTLRLDRLRGDPPERRNAPYRGRLHQPPAQRLALAGRPDGQIRLAGVRTAAHPAPAPEISVAL